MPPPVNNHFHEQMKRFVSEQLAYISLNWLSIRLMSWSDTVRKTTSILLLLSLKGYYSCHCDCPELLKNTCGTPAGIQAGAELIMVMNTTSRDYREAVQKAPNGIFNSNGTHLSSTQSSTHKETRWILFIPNWWRFICLLKGSAKDVCALLFN